MLENVATEKRSIPKIVYVNLVMSVQVEATSHTTKQVEQDSRLGRSELAPLWSFQYDFVPVNDSLLGSCRIVVYQSISLENESQNWIVLV